MNCVMCETFEGKSAENTLCKVWVVKDGNNLHIELEGKPDWKCESFVVEMPFNYCPECGKKWRWCKNCLD